MGMCVGMGATGSGRLGFPQPQVSPGAHEPLHCLFLWWRQSVEFMPNARHKLNSDIFCFVTVIFLAVFISNSSCRS